jgi:serine/threonine protein kinase
MLSSDARALIEKLLTRDYKHRIAAEVALTHSWFQKAKKGELPKEELG